ncbi:MAG: hypothetical protein ACK418_04005 [Pseudomonas sp.]|uniref:hypothetical protein n=1 Tax=Pseudomonas sp. TaxID=306 RepID=UPI00391921F5
MDDFRALALTWDTLPDETALPVSINPSTTYLRERQDLRIEGDQALITQLVNLLSPASGQALPSARQPLPIPGHSHLGQWSDAFSKAINMKDFIAWAEAKRFDFNTLRVHDSTLLVTARRRPSVFTLADASGWWRLANPIIYISQLLDPMALGMPYIGPKLGTLALTLPLDITLAFHGLPMPANRFEALTLVEELRDGQRFPGFDDSGNSRSIIHVQRRQQRRDYLQLALALEPMAEDESTFDTWDIYRTRLHLTSNSRLARSLKEAAVLVQALVNENTPDSAPIAPGNAYFDHQQHLLCVLSPDKAFELKRLAPVVPDARWFRLVQLGEQLGVDIYSDHSLSASSALLAYGIERPDTLPQLSALIQRLRQEPTMAAPVVPNAARSFSELYRYRQYVGQLNDKHAVRTALAGMIESADLQGPEGLERVITGDPETLQALMRKAAVHLRVLTGHPTFLAIRTRERIAPDSHVLISDTGGIGALGLDGTWISLTDAVMADAELATLLVVHLKPLAAKTGGYLRTNEAVTLAQALRLYGLKVPGTLEEASVTLRRLEISQPLPVSQGHYWRALKSKSASQPSAWTLTGREHHLIMAVIDRFMADHALPLVEYLGQGTVADKSVDAIRAEADFLMVRLLASPLAQQLGDELMSTLPWQGSPTDEQARSDHRHALILAALILSLDPQPRAHPTRINHLDWHDDYFWGQPASFMRTYVEASLLALSPQVAVLAAHLLLCEKSPQLLVRGIPDSTPCLSAHLWALYRQYVLYMEKVSPGSSRQVSYQQIMWLASQTPAGRWKTFLNSREAKWPILEWAVANGVLASPPPYGRQAITTAVGAFNAQLARLNSTLETFDNPIISLRQTALNDLRKVYPGNTLLDARVLMWLPEHSPFSEEDRFEDVHTGSKFSFVDLHMAGALDADNKRWHSSDKAIKYREMARQFHLLGQINQVFFEAFDQKLAQLNAAYQESIRYGMSQLTLPERQALEFGLVQFFSLSQRVAPADAGRFGLLVYVSHDSHSGFYEFFPRQRVIRPRRDLDYEHVTHAIDAVTRPVWMRFDWSAYRHGTAPAALGPAPTSDDLILRRLDDELDEAADLPPLDALGRRVPRTLDSPRSHALTDIVAHHLLHDAQPLREKARQPITLEAAVSNEDPWADYLRGLALAPD